MQLPVLTGMEGVFIPIKDPQVSATWYEEKLGFTLLYIEAEAAVMKIADVTQTVVCLVRSKEHQPMKFPKNNFGVDKYYNFRSHNIEETYRHLVEKNVKVTAIDGDGTTKYFTFYDPDGNPLGVCQ
ncbi:VOC family protein [Lysinibacillus parviboronicapiens]|uniref:Glyoxylase I family protein n=1 Tax=Lysinibacillus parviboronicapiens TaxID=436516 RepID=A0ABV2PMY9_9BACI|nr:VOC family protein [Lysinibacillus parviboronicapiens]